VRYQSGIDDVLRAEGLDGGLNELRGLMRGGLSGSVLSHAAGATQQPSRASGDQFIPDKSREYPAEGADAYGALPEDLLPGAFVPAATPAAATDNSPPPAVESPPAAPPPAASPPAASPATPPPAEGNG